jgi:TPR repeat protein
MAVNSPRGLPALVAVLALLSAGPARAAETPELKEAKKGCEANKASSCYTAGKIYAEGTGVKTDPKKAAPFLQKACDGGIAKACTNLGHLYESVEGGLGAQPDPARAVGLYQKACNGGEYEVCVTTAKALVYGDLGKDAAKAADLFSKACAGSVKDACFDGAEMIDNQLHDSARSLTLYDQGCTAGDLACCYNGSRILLTGGGEVAKDAAKAAALLEKACEGKAVRPLEKAFEKVPATSCFNLATLYRDGDGVQADPARARALFKKACEGGIQQACDSSGPVAGPDRSGLASWLTACDGGNGRACLGVGQMYERGLFGLPKDAAQAAKFYQKACAVGDADGCEGLKRLARQP